MRDPKEMVLLVTHRCQYGLPEVPSRLSSTELRNLSPPEMNQRPWAFHPIPHENRKTVGTAFCKSQYKRGYLKTMWKIVITWKWRSAKLQNHWSCNLFCCSLPRRFANSLLQDTDSMKEGIRLYPFQVAVLWTVFLLVQRDSACLWVYFPSRLIRDHCGSRRKNIMFV